jgi:predicted RNA-binding protein YlxR (DUF448 family)
LRVRKIPMRKCVGCNEQSPKKELVRIVRQSGGEIHVDPTGKMNGRGAYIHPKADCLQMAKKRRSLERALSASIPEEVYDTLSEELDEG